MQEPPVQAVIIAVGDELTCGATVDTNSAYLSRRLCERGIATLRQVTVGDDAGAIAAAVSAAAGDAGVVLVTGGLGPTADDLTRQGLARAMGAKLREDRRQAERIAAFFAARRRPMKPSNRAQALIPAGAEPLDNDCGTAPGIAARVGSAEVFVLPGPPREMEAMFEVRVLPRLPSAGAIASRTLHAFGAGESDIGEEIADLMGREQNPTVGTTAEAGVITVRITATGGCRRAAEDAAEKIAGEIRWRLGELVFGAGGQTLAEVVGGGLRAAGATLAVAESCTGGMLGGMITAAAGASDYFLGGVTAYANRAKVALLGVDAGLVDAQGAVSGPVAEAMAEGVRRKLGADYGLAVTGIAGPAGGSADKPVGLVFIGIASGGGTSARRHIFGGDRDTVRRRAALAALNHLRLELAGGRGEGR